MLGGGDSDWAGQQAARALDQGSISEIGENGECHLGNF